MNATIRRIAVSGSAAVALLGGAAAITAATAPTASAADMQTVITQATGTPVTLPDGRTTYVRGMDAAAYTATPEQHTVILAAANTGADPSTSPDLTTGLTPGAGTPLQNPVNGQQTGYNQQITTQASGGVIGVGIVSILILAIIVYYKVRHSGLKAADAALGVVAGVAIGGTFLGPMISNMTNSLVGSLGTMLAGLS